MAAHRRALAAVLMQGEDMIALGLLLPALTISLVVWIVRTSRHGALQERGGWSLRRLLQHLFLLVTLFSAANGVTRVLAAAMRAGRRRRASLGRLVAVPRGRGHGVADHRLRQPRRGRYVGAGGR